MDKRVNYQNQQVKFFQSRIKKFAEAKRVRMPNRIKLTPQEQDVFDYFHGTGFYKDYQNPKTSPNIFDTRKSFLLKMQDRDMRTKFLNSYVIISEN